MRKSLREKKMKKIKDEMKNEGERTSVRVWER